MNNTAFIILKPPHSLLQNDVCPDCKLKIIASGNALLNTDTCANQTLSFTTRTQALIPLYREDPVTQLWQKAVVKYHCPIVLLLCCIFFCLFVFRGGKGCFATVFFFFFFFCGDVFRNDKNFLLSLICLSGTLVNKKLLHFLTFYHFHF